MERRRESQVVGEAVELRSRFFEAPIRSESYLAETLRRLLKNKGAALGGLFLLTLVVIAIFAPFIAAYDPIEVYPTEARQAPNLKHLAGTDRLGRDAMSRIIFGTRISLRVGLIGVAIALSLGGTLGLYAGYYGGRIDTIVCMLVNIMLAFPGILLSLSIVAVLGPGLENVMVAVGISSIPQFLRVVRSSVLSAKENVYVEAAKVAGCSNRRIIFRHILPNVVAPVIILSTLWVGTAILIGASVSFLGLGVQPPTPEWGLMVSDGRNYLTTMWWLSTFPGLAIALTVLAMNLLGDGLRDALDPRLR